MNKEIIRVVQEENVPHLCDGCIYEDDRLSCVEAPRCWEIVACKVVYYIFVEKENAASE